MPLKVAMGTRMVETEAGAAARETCIEPSAARQQCYDIYLGY